MEEHYYFAVIDFGGPGLKIIKSTGWKCFTSIFYFTQYEYNSGEQ